MGSTESLRSEISHYSSFALIQFALTDSYCMLLLSILFSVNRLGHTLNAEGFVSYVAFPPCASILSFTVREATRSTRRKKLYIFNNYSPCLNKNNIKLHLTASLFAFGPLPSNFTWALAQKKCWSGDEKQREREREGLWKFLKANVPKCFKITNWDQQTRASVSQGSAVEVEKG